MKLTLEYSSAICETWLLPLKQLLQSSRRSTRGNADLSMSNGEEMEDAFRPSDIEGPGGSGSGTNGAFLIIQRFTSPLFDTQ